ncbi:DUF4886 domain-containing protein [Palleronia sp. LCG004]|uniref:DUF4886 domain-containing protein n=1 Tax=Palleronia sp. LCG004 TaxID=3079304 RepID=UPI002942ECF1|nr:DUF4886 domain-containing protein [Palleronia sp. LCG004]WOI56574.1 hypothetical protein RVY76_01895 [Palleronia sp. LCG004]
MIRHYPAIVAGVVCAAPAISQDAPAPQKKALSEENPGQILFVGNSYLYYGDSIHNHVVRMARAAYPDDRFTYKSATISGSYLDQHEISSYLEPGRLGLDDPFDVVILQGHSAATTTEDRLDRFAAAVREDAPQVEEHGAEVALYMTPAYTEENDDYDPEMFAQIDRGYTEVGNEVDAVIIPVGLAFELAYEARPELELHKHFDGSHPTLLGTYLAAATVYAALYEESAVGNSYDYYGAIPAEDTAFLQEIAEEAVSAYTSR